MLNTKNRVWIWLISPAALWFLFFLLIPLIIVVTYSFSRKGVYGGVELDFQFNQFVRAMDWIYLKIFWNSLKLATSTTISCLLIGYPLAYYIATSSHRVRNLLLVLVVIPFWTNFVVRTYALKLILSESGPLAQATEWAWMQIKGPMGAGIWGSIQGDLGVWLGMVTNYLPFMVLPLYVTLEKFDYTLLEAAEDLGAGNRQSFTRVLLPLTRPGIITGVLFVFTPALGEFVIPDMLGGAQTFLLGNLLTEQFLKSRDWPFGSALSMILVLFFMVSLWMYLRIEEGTQPRQKVAKKRELRDVVVS